MVGMEERAPSAELVTCRCNFCDGHIQFERDHADENVTCPHCGMETKLYTAPTAQVIPTAPPPLPPLPPQTGQGIANVGGDYVFLYEGGIIVTKTRFMAHGQTFALANITSVSPVQIPARAGGAFIVMLLGAVALLAAIGAFAGAGVGGVDARSNMLLGIFCALVGLPAVAGGIYLMATAKPSYAIVLNTAGGEVKTCHSRNGDFILRVVAALNKAIVSRG